jgi:hypothetical protein
MEASSLTNRSEALSFLSGKPSGAMDISRYHNWIIGSLPQLWKRVRHPKYHQYMERLAE